MKNLFFVGVAVCAGAVCGGSVEPIRPDYDKPNYDKAKIAPYTLEDPLTFLDGRKLKSASEWPARRREILGIFAREMFGQEPPTPEAVVVEKFDDAVSLAGFGIRRQYRMWFKADKTGPAIDWLVLLPRYVKKPVPPILFLNYGGNHELIRDPEVTVSKSWMAFRKGNRAEPEARGKYENMNSVEFVFPAHMILARGYALMSACYADVSPDTDPGKGRPPEDAFKEGVFTLWPPRDESRDDNPTSIGAWAWALSRGLDLAERMPEIDAKKAIATGYSRLGKTALLAAARDERFAVCVPNQTGGGGCPLAKRDFGENIATEMAWFPHWYCRAYAKYAKNPPRTLTFDQHLLLASIAPRALMVQGYDVPWFDTEGEYLACRSASPVWEFLGKPGLPDRPFPPDYDTSCVGPQLAYVRRTEGHGHSAQDWTWLMDFADKFFDIHHPGKPKPLNDGWTADGAPVTLPHCWNVEDGTDGPTDMKCWNHDSVAGMGYARRKVVYRRELLPSEKTRWLRVNAASIHAVVRVDGHEVGRHAGAFTAFTVEVPRGGKVVEIEVDNFYDPDVPPVCGDFTMYGGLYRGVDLLDKPEMFLVPTDLPKYEFREDGFYVDGGKTFLKGVCYHQDREGKGWAISAEDEEEDIRLIKAMGANAIRTSHYPRSERFYDLCDKYGIYVWTEIPLVDATTASETFRSNTLNVAREMVLQHRHHKCIAMWGIFNELYLKKMPDGQAEPLVREVKELIRSLDPRPIVAASNNPKKKELNAIPDALGFNMYPGWYIGESTDLGREIEEWRSMNGRPCVAISEYGAGGSLGQPMPSPDYRPQPDGKCHPVDYQLKHHQASWAAIKANPRVWGCFVWVMFDVGSDNRHEGARDGLNDKGLVGFDHKTLKPAYEFYRSEWSK